MLHGSVNIRAITLHDDISTLYLYISKNYVKYNLFARHILNTDRIL